jgi:DNA-binding IclR family transcriptional regulator
VIQSVERAIAILRCFEEYEELGVTEISALVGLNKSTAFGLINTLRNENFIQADEKTGKLRLGMSLLRLSEHIKQDLRNICTPYIMKLLHTTKETVNLAVLDGDNAIFIEKQESPHVMRISTTISRPIPLYCTAAGKAILSCLQDVEIEDYLKRVKLKPFTEKTITSKAVLWEQIQHIRTEGYALDNEEMEYGIICIAVPLIGSNRKIAGGLSITGPLNRMTEAKRLNIKELLLKTADEINRKI